MKVLVTGATGFIGSHLCERLAKDGHDVAALVRNDSGRQECLEILKKLRVKICRGDITDPGALESAVKGNEIVFHLAAIARPMAIPREEYFRVNEGGTRNLLEACRKAGVRKIVHMSSVSAVGPTRDGRPVNEGTQRAPVDVYGESKLAAEDVVQEYVKRYGMDVVVLRPPMVFGPRDAELLRLFRFIAKGFFPVKPGKGYMEFLYVENLVEACVLAAEKKTKRGEIFHVTNGRSYRIQEIVGAIAEAEGVRLSGIRFPNWAFIAAGAFVEFLGLVFRFHPPFSRGTVVWMTKSFWYSDSSKARRILGYRPPYGLDEGVKKTVGYYRKRHLI